MDNPPLKLLSVLIPARNEEGCIAATVEHLHLELALNKIPHEIVVIDDGSTDSTWNVLQELTRKHAALRPLRNTGLNGFGRAVTQGIDAARGDAIVVMMADESDDCRDVVKYWTLLNEGWDCVFGSRFMKGGGVIDYPWLKLRLNRIVNSLIRVLFKIQHNDITKRSRPTGARRWKGAVPFSRRTSISPLNCR